jgi:ABC-type nickel/cobalt efflux system permease component RcnA
MDAMVLRFLLASCISLGMAATISCVSIAVIVGKNRALKLVSNRHAERIEAAAGLLSGLAITVFEGLFLLTEVNVAL